MASNFETGIRLTDEEKEMVGRAIYEAKRKNPEISWRAALDAGRALLPKGQKIPATILSPTAYPWMVRMLKKLGEENGHHVLNSGKKYKKSKQEQKEQFAEACYKLRKENRDMRWIDIFSELNKTSPMIGATVNSPNQIKWLQALLEQCEAEDRARQQAEREIKVLPETKPATTETAEEAKPAAVSLELPPKPENTEECRALKDSEILPIAPPAGMMTLETALINAIVGTVTPMIMNILQSPEFSDALRTAFVAPILTGATETKPVTSVTPTPPKEVRQKILIVGLLPQQGQEIHQLYGKRYDLRIFDSNVTSEKIRSLMPNMDRAIVMTKFISHRVQDVLRGHAGFCHCNGSVAALKELLNTRDAH